MSAYGTKRRSLVVAQRGFPRPGTVKNVLARLKAKAHEATRPGLLHGIGWTPDESEVWESSNDSHVYVWGMLDPMSPRLKEQLSLRSQRGTHWLTFDLRGDYAYVAPRKNSDDGTEIFNARTHASVGLIGSSEDMIEIDFADGQISRVGDQYGVGRATRD